MPQTLLPIIEEHVRLDSIVDTDTFRSYHALDISCFRHVRINHSELFAHQDNHSNGIENFWNQAKCRMRRFNRIKPENYYWLLKEYEWHFIQTVIYSFLANKISSINTTNIKLNLLNPHKLLLDIYPYL